MIPYRQSLVDNSIEITEVEGPPRDSDVAELQLKFSKIPADYINYLKDNPTCSYELQSDGADGRYMNFLSAAGALELNQSAYWLEDCPYLFKFASDGSMGSFMFDLNELPPETGIVVEMFDGYFSPNSPDDGTGKRYQTFEELVDALANTVL